MRSYWDSSRKCLKEVHESPQMVKDSPKQLKESENLQIINHNGICSCSTRALEIVPNVLRPQVCAVRVLNLQSRDIH